MLKATNTLQVLLDGFVPMVSGLPDLALSLGFLIGWLGFMAFVGYLTPNPFLCK